MSEETMNEFSVIYCNIIVQNKHFVNNLKIKNHFFYPSKGLFRGGNQL